MSKLLTYRLELDEKGEGWILNQNDRRMYRICPSETYVVINDMSGIAKREELDLFNLCVKENGETRKQSLLRKLQELEDNDNEYYNFLKINKRLKEIL